MFSPLRQMFRGRSTPARPPAAVPEGQRFYVIGDVHGRRDLFDALIREIEEDERSAPAGTRTAIVLLGDLIDRGPDSAGVVKRARELQSQRTVHLIAGNHEEMFLAAFEDRAVLRQFLRYGGKETVLSYGLPPHVYEEATLEEIQAQMAELVPEEDRRFLASARDYIEAGDYLFVHAGIAPDVPLDQQTHHHFRWIREPFLGHEGAHQHFVVHGHTITDEVDARTNRIGIDTGAYRSGRLTALVLEGTTRRTIQVVETDGSIAVETGALAT